MTRRCILAILLAIAVLLADRPAPASANALISFDFEAIPDQYLFEGTTNLGNYYPGVTFGPDARILDALRSGADYTVASFPPHSGVAVLFAKDSAYLTATFATPTDHVEIWYTCGITQLSFQAFDAAHNLVASTIGAINIGQNNFLEVNAPVNAPKIKSVTISGAQQNFTIDNFGYQARLSLPATGLLLLEE